MDKAKFELLMKDAEIAKKSPKKETALTQVFNNHKDFFGSLSAEEALEVENALGFWTTQDTSKQT